MSGGSFILLLQIMKISKALSLDVILIRLDEEKLLFLSQWSFLRTAISKV